MNQRTQYLIQVLEKIGGPLMNAVTSVYAESTTDGDSLPDEAQRIAELLAKTVQTSIDVAKATDMSGDAGDDDSLRVGLSALVSPMIATFFQQNKSVPGDPDIKKLVGALQAVIAFSENFQPSDENIGRLKEISANGKAHDINQINLQYMTAFVPIIHAVHNFPFGQQEQKLITDINNRLSKKAMEIREVLLSSSDEAEQKLCELAIITSLAKIYAACHEAETQKLTGSDNANASIDTVWSAFDLRAAMLETLAGNIVPGGHAKPAANPVTPPLAAPTETPVTPAAPTEPKQEAPPPAAPATETPAQTPPAKANPMGMFAKKPAGETSPPATPTAEVPPSETPPQAPPAAPAEDQKDSDKSDDEGNKGGGGPMAFFKKGDE